MKYEQLPSNEIIEKTKLALEKHNYNVVSVKTGQEALSKIKEIIPENVSVMNGASTTLEQIGYINYLKSGEHKWNNLHEAIVAEKDPIKQGMLRKQAALSDYYLGSVHALTETGEFIVASNTGSQLPNIVNTSPNLVFVVSTKKIVADLPSAMKRLEEHVVPLEDKRMTEAFGMGTTLNKVLIFKGDAPFLGRKISFILVKENLGF